MWLRRWRRGCRSGRRTHVKMLMVLLSNWRKGSKKKGISSTRNNVIILKLPMSWHLKCVRNWLPSTLPLPTSIFLYIQRITGFEEYLVKFMQSCQRRAALVDQNSSFRDAQKYRGDEEYGQDVQKDENIAVQKWGWYQLRSGWMGQPTSVFRGGGLIYDKYLKW